MLKKTPQQNVRIESVDVLRGLAVMAIMLLHCIEHFNFYSNPETPQFEWLPFTDRAIWDGLFFAFAGKAYAVFALLFGFSFYIQDRNQRLRGNDFRLRFLWRLFLLLLIGQFNAMFFTGEIFTLYALVGVVLVLFCRLKDKALLALAIFFLLQPMDWAKVIYALFNTDYIAGKSMASYYFGIAFEVQQNGNFLETVKMNLWEGQLASLTWALENARVMQTAGLFLLGLYIGRKEYFLDNKSNHRVWLKAVGYGLLIFFPFYGLYNMIPDFIDRSAILKPLLLILKSWYNFGFMIMLVGAFLLVFHLSKDNSILRTLSPYGKMSMSNYIGQSMVGSLLFYNWGFHLGRYLGTTFSFLLGILLFLLQLSFCTWWLNRYPQGPFERLWKKLTWVGSGRKI